MRILATGAAFCIAGIIAASAAQHGGVPNLALIGAVAVGVPLVLWMFLSENLDRPLMVLLLYFGLLDGSLRLLTGVEAVTLIRDVLMVAILGGWLARAALRREKLSLPPLSGWVLAFTLAVLVQIFNPNDAGKLHTLAALRPHLEFVPLFFVGYGVLRTRRRLQTFFLLMLVIASANGVVGLIQLDLTPAQLSSWGPGYAARIKGGDSGLGAVSSRTFDTTSGQQRVRPPGLGSDEGVGGEWGMLALGGALALVSLGAFRSLGRWSLVLFIGPPLAIITGEARTFVVASVASLLVYVLLATSKSRLVPTVAGVILGIVIIIGVGSYIDSVSGSSTFDRYLTITPSKLASTTASSRGSSLASVPHYVTQHPLGNGLGGVGPAAQIGGGGVAGSNGETEPTYLLSETGIPGLVIIYGFFATLLLLGVTRVRRLDPRDRPLVAGLVAGVAALLVAGITSAPTSTSPEAPYLWLAGGAISYWLVTGYRQKPGGVGAGSRTGAVRPPLSAVR